MSNALKTVIGVVSFGFILYVVLFRTEVLLAIFYPGDEHASLSILLLDTENQDFEMDFSSLKEDLTLLILVSPAGHCSTCLPLAKIWDDQASAFFDSKRIAVYLIGDGRQTSLKAMQVYLESYRPKGKVLYDPAGLVREKFHLSSGPLAVGISRNTAVLFTVPLTQAYEDELSAPALARRFVQASISRE